MNYRPEAILLAYKYTDARRWRRRIDNRRRSIKPFPVTIRPIIAPAMLIAVAVMTTSSMFITPVVISAIAAMVVSEGRHHVYTADQCCENQSHDNLTRYGSKFPYT
jgi:hypothetical protein